MMEITKNTALECAHHEAIIRQAYKDSVGVWTWSVGLTNATGHNVERYIDNPQTLEHCLDIYIWALNNYADTVRAVFADHPLNENEFAGAASFHWNTGAIKTASWVGYFKAGNMKEAEKRFKQWNKAGGKVSDGLTKRRAAEWDLIAKAKWANNGKMLEYTKLKSDYSPNWSSGVYIEVDEALDAVFAQRDREAALADENKRLSEKADKLQEVVEKDAKVEGTSQSVWQVIYSALPGWVVAAGLWVQDNFDLAIEHFTGLSDVVKVAIMATISIGIICWAIVYRRQRGKAAKEALE